MTLTKRAGGGSEGERQGGLLWLRNRKRDEESLQKAVHSLIRQRRVGRPWESVVENERVFGGRITAGQLSEGHSFKRERERQSLSQITGTVLWVKRNKMVDNVFFPGDAWQTWGCVWIGCIVYVSDVHNYNVEITMTIHMRFQKRHINWCHENFLNEKKYKSHCKEFTWFVAEKAVKNHKVVHLNMAERPSYKKWRSK